MPCRRRVDIDIRQAAQFGCEGGHWLLRLGEAEVLEDDGTLRSGVDRLLQSVALFVGEGDRDAEFLRQGGGDGRVLMESTFLPLGRPRWLARITVALFSRGA